MKTKGIAFVWRMCAVWLLWVAFVPPALAMTEEESLELLFPAAVMHERFRVVMAESQVHDWARLQAGRLSPPFPPGALTDEQLQAILSRLDVLTTRLVSPLDPGSRELGDGLRQRLRKASWSGLDKVPLRPGDGEALRAQREFEREALAMSVFHLPLRYLAPHKLERDPSLSEEARRPLPSDLPEHALIHHILTADIRSILPPRFNLDRLRQLSQNDRAAAVARPSLRLINSQLATDVMSRGGIDLWAHALERHKDHVERTLREMQSLSVRIDLMVNPRVSGYCDALGLDGPSVAASGGDWHKVRLADQSPLQANSFDMGRLVNAYTRGCHVPSSLPIARKLLHQWAEAVRSPPREGGKLNLEAECKLALWMRHGVGGERSARQADAQEAQVQAEAGASCNPRSLRDLIDPRDPMRDLGP